MPKKAPKKPDVAELMRKYIRSKEAGRKAYKRSDGLMQQIAAIAKPGEQVELSEKLAARLKDNFDTDKGIIWTPCAARRWDLEIVDR